MIGIIQEISAKVRQMTKSAQVDSYYWLHTNDPKQNEINMHMNGQSSAAMYKGIAKGIRETLPSVVNYAIGPIAGVINGGIHAATGGKFATGYRDSTEFADRYMAQPIRNALMYYGGDKVKEYLGKMDAYHDSKARELLGDGNKEYESFRNGFLPLVSDANQYVTQFALTTPLITKWLGSLRPAAAANAGGKAIRFASGAIPFAPLAASTVGEAEVERDDNAERVRRIYEDPNTSEEKKRMIEAARPDLRPARRN